MKLSLLNSNKHLRLYNRIKSRLNALSKIYTYLSEKSYISDQCHEYYNNHVSGLINLLNQLDTNYLICNTSIYQTVFNQFKTYPKSNRDHVYTIFGIKYEKTNKYTTTRLNQLLREEQYLKKKVLYYRLSKPTYDELSRVQQSIKSEQSNIDKLNYLINLYKIKARNARKSDFTSRLQNEVLLRQKQGWYFIFSTLTVDPLNYEKVFNSKSSIWTDYIRSIDRAIAKTSYGSLRKAKKERTLGNDYYSYFACVERGSDKGRLHIHVLHMCKSLPIGSVDPNIGRIQPFHRDVQSFTRYWKYGLVQKNIAVRFDNNDAYAKLNWRWPVTKLNNNYIPLKYSSPNALVNYLVKYITKSIDQPIHSKDNLSWRIRISRNLGKTVLSQMMNQMTNSQLITVIKNNQSLIYKIKNKCQSNLMMKNLALKFYLKRRFYKNKLKNTNKESNSPYKKQRLWAFLRTLTPTISLFKRLKLLIWTPQIYNLANTGVSRIQNLSKMAVSNLIKFFNNYIENVFKSSIVFYGLAGNPYTK